MKILNYFRMEADIESIPEDIWDEKFSEKIPYYGVIPNCFDESAMALVLAFSAPSGIEIKRDVLSFCDDRSDSFLKKLYALGFDNVTKIINERDIMEWSPEFFPEYIAGLITDFAGKEDYDLIVLGEESGESNMPILPYFVANKLERPLLEHVYDMELSQEGVLEVTVRQKNTYIRYQIDKPCVLSVGNAVKSYLPLPTLKDRIKSENRSTRTINVETSVIDDSVHRVKKMEVIDLMRSAIPVSCHSETDAARYILEKYLIKESVL